MTSVTAQRDGHHDRCVMADADRFLRVCYLDRVQVCANEIKSRLNQVVRHAPFKRSAGYAAASDVCMM